MCECLHAACGWHPFDRPRSGSGIVKQLTGTANHLPEMMHGMGHI